MFTSSQLAKNPVKYSDVRVGDFFIGQDWLLRLKVKSEADGNGEHLIFDSKKELICLDDIEDANVFIDSMVYLADVDILFKRRT